MGKLFRWIAIIVLSFIALSLIISIASENKPSKNAKKKAIVEQPAENWEYDSDTDKMTSTVVYFASLNADRDMQLKFPYQGGSMPSINIRYKNGVPSAYLHITKGQLIAAHAGQDGEIRVRFDQEPADTYEVSGAADYSPNYLFINHASYFIKKLKTCKHLIVETEVYDNGIRQMEFNTSNLKWDH